MKTNNCGSSIASSIAWVAVILVITVVMPLQSATAKSSESETSAGWSVQVDQVDPGTPDLSSSFQVAIYENLLQEMGKTKQFREVLRDGDRKAAETPNLLVLKTTVERYTKGSETRRAATTVTGATKLTVRSQLVTRGGKVVLERTVNGEVRFFGSNMRATHNLARNIAKTIKQSPLTGLDQPAATPTGQL
jgi:hypothetical protein